MTNHAATGENLKNELPQLRFFSAIQDVQKLILAKAAVEGFSEEIELLMLLRDLMKEQNPADASLSISVPGEKKDHHQAKV